MKTLGILIIGLIIIYSYYITEYYKELQIIELYLTNEKGMLGLKETTITYELIDDTFLILPAINYTRATFKTPQNPGIISQTLSKNSWDIIDIDNNHFIYCPVNNCRDSKIFYKGIAPGEYILSQPETITFSNANITWKEKGTIKVNNSGEAVIEIKGVKNLFGTVKLTNIHNNVSYILPLKSESNSYSVDNILSPDEINNTEYWILKDNTIYCLKENCETLNITLPLKDGEYYLKIKTNDNSSKIETITNQNKTQTEAKNGYYLVKTTVENSTILLNNNEGAVYIREIEAISTESLSETFDFTVNVINPKKEKLTLNITAYNTNTTNIIYSRIEQINESAFKEPIKLKLNETGLIKINIWLLKGIELIRENRIWVNITNEIIK